MLSQVRELVTEGASLADALKAHPRIFGDLYVNMVRAGEASGALDLVLIRLADYTEKYAALRDKVRSSLTYPTFMAVFGSIILFVLLSYVVPKITKMFSENQGTLPLMTTILLAVSGFMQQYWWLIAGTVIMVVLSIRLSIRTPAGRLRFDRYSPVDAVFRQARQESRPRPLCAHAFHPAHQQYPTVALARHRQERGQQLGAQRRDRRCAFEHSRRAEHRPAA